MRPPPLAKNTMYGNTLSWHTLCVYEASSVSESGRRERMERGRREKRGMGKGKGEKVYIKSDGVKGGEKREG